MYAIRSYYGYVTRDEYWSDDIATTVYMKLGIPHELIAKAPDGQGQKRNLLEAVAKCT